MDDQKIGEVRVLQNLLGGYSDTALEQLKMLPYMIFHDIGNYKMELTDEQITVSLLAYKGLKGKFLRWRYKKQDAERAKLLAKYILFWLPKGKVKPKVIIQWQT